MKKLTTAEIINRIAIAMLLLASAFYHVQQGLTVKKQDISQVVFESSLTIPLSIFPQQNLINHKPIFLCVN